jgi:PadR family transcriptional regulator PadR
MSDIFLSYSHQDRERVRPVVALLEAQGWAIWWDRTLLPGQHWEDQLREELKNCRAVVVVWTRNSVTSKWVQLEASEGLKIDGLVPIQLDQFEAAPIPNDFKHIHAADLTTWTGGTNHPELAGALRALREIVSRPATAPSLADSTNLPYSLSLGGDLGSTDPKDLMWIDSNVREAGRNAVPALLAALEFPEPERRGHAAYLLGLTGDRTVVRSLAPLLADRSQVALGLEWMPTVRAAAANALKEIGTTEALRALDNDRTHVRRLAVAERPIDAFRGSLDLLVLKTLSLSPTHGWGISQRVQQMSSGEFEMNQGSLYPALQRLEKDGLITSEWGVTDNNRQARYYRLTAAGRRALGREVDDWKRFAAALDAVLRTS